MTVAQVHSEYVLLWDGHSFREAVLAGRLRADRTSRDGNPLAVGDVVETEPGDPGPLRVIGVAARRTHLERSAGARGGTQIIAANADRALIVSSLAEPPFRPGLVDRWTLLAHRGGMEPVLCVNKLDLASREEAERVIADAGVGLVHFLVSAETGEGVDRLREHLAGTTTVLVGHSGVGKSSLLMRLFPGSEITTGALSEKSGKGRHTTTSARLYPLPEGGVLIDTGGVRSVVLGETQLEEVIAIFPEIAMAPPCRFRPCTHRAEPGCRVLLGLEEGVVSRGVYGRYRKLLEEVVLR